MSLRCGIVGLPNVGKSTLFNALTAAGAEAENYPFCTIEPNVGVVSMPDPRLDEVARIIGSARTVPATLEVVDIAGLVEGASKGEGLGNQFLAHIRQVDAIVHVVRCFEDDNVVHVSGKPDPLRDAEVVSTELLLKDLETVERRIERTERAAKGGDKRLKAELEFYGRLQAHLSDGKWARTFVPGEEWAQTLSELYLLTRKSVLYVANVAEEDLAGSALVAELEGLARKEGSAAVVVSAEVEAQIAELDAAERMDFLSDMGLSESGLDRLAHAAYALLGLITFFTAGPTEARAWEVPKGTLAPAAAGKIHTDFQRGFIRAETVKYTDLVRLGSEAAARAAGAMRSEGKDYVVQDGDVILFRFNV
jgi:GTP-binding protein YchF